MFREKRKRQSPRDKLPPRLAFIVKGSEVQTMLKKGLPCGPGGGRGREEKNSWNSKYF